MKAALTFALLLGVSAPAMARPLAIVHAEAWLGKSALSDATIVIDGGQIVSVAAAGRAPGDAEVIDAGGKPVTPGLMNGAAQLGVTEVASASGTRDVASQSRNYSAGFDLSRALNGNSTLVALARADGVTEALSYPAKSKVPPLSGLAALVTLRPGSDILDKRAAALFVVIGGGAWRDDASSRAVQWQLLDAALDNAADAKAGSSADRAVLADVLAGKIPLAIETNRESDIREAAKLATARHIHVVIVGGAEAWRAADVLAAANIPVILDPYANLPTTFDELGNRLDAAALLDKAGVAIAFGEAGGAIEETLNAGLALREGAGLAVANGLPRDAALRAVTSGPRAIWGAAPVEIAKGSRADLVVWDGDPLEPSTNAVAVVIGGVRVSTDTRQRALGERYRDGAKR